MSRVTVCSALIIAHQGGWDEILFVAAPIALFVLLLRLANRRADAQRGKGAEPTDESTAPTDEPTAADSGDEPTTPTDEPAPPAASDDGHPDQSATP